LKPSKPLYRQPCNGCGLCCIMEQCPLSVIAFGEVERCPAIVDAGDRFACGLIVQPERYFPPAEAAHAAMLVGIALGIGTFCDAIDAEGVDRDLVAELGE